MASETMEQSARISIVDDDDSVRRALSRLCRSAGFRAESYETAEAFLETACLEKMDCLILDVHLPGRSGLQLQLELKAAGRQFPIVFVTAYEDERAQIQALENGAFDFLHKPIDSERLLDVIRRAIHHRV